MIVYSTCVPIAVVQAQPDASSECVTEVLYGEQFNINQHHDDWLDVSLMRDGYRGFIQATQANLSASTAAHAESASHWVYQRSTLLFSEPSIKSAVLHRIPYGSELQLQPSGIDSFSKTSTGHFVWTEHCLRADQLYPGTVLTLASNYFLGAPYRWGGRSPEGIDCSGLIQALARAQGISIPRDSKDQEPFISTQVPLDELARLDLVYWPGHTGILVSPTHILHATAFTLDCRIEALDDVVKRAGTISSVRRLFDASQA